MPFVRVQFRRGTSTQWTNANPILADGEMAIETDTRQFKIGNGVSSWTTLPYGGLVGPQGSLSSIVNQDISFNTKISVALDSSFNSNLVIGRDLSVNRFLRVGADASFNANLYVLRDVSMGSNLVVANKVGIGKVAGAPYALDVAGNINIASGNLFLGGTAFTSTDLSLNARLSVGSDASFVGNVFLGKTLNYGRQSVAAGGSSGSPVAVTATTSLLELNGADGTNYFTLAAGTYNGQVLQCVSIAAGGQGLFLNATMKINGSTCSQVRFSAVQQSISLMWSTSASAWIVVGWQGVNFNGTSLNFGTYTTGDINFSSANRTFVSSGVLQVAQNTLLDGNLFVAKDVSLSGKLYTVGDSSLNGNLSVGGNIVLTGPLHIRETTGTDATTSALSSTGTLILSHANNPGVSSIVFRSSADPGTDMAYIKYQDDFNGTGQASLLTIGVENNLSQSTGDRISIYPNDGSGRVGINTKTPMYNLDVSGSLFANSTAIFNSTTFIVGDASLSSKLFVNGDSSLNSNLAVGRDISGGGNLFLTGSIFGSNRAFIANDVSMGSRLFVVGDASLSGKLNTVGDVSFNGNLAVGRDISGGGNLFLTGSLFGANRAFINNDVSMGSRLFVVGDASMSSRLFVNGDVSFNGNLAVGRDISGVGNLFITRRAFINNDVSMGSRLFVVGDVSMSSRLFVNGDVSFNGNLSVGRDISGVGNLFLSGPFYGANRAFINNDVSMGSRLFVVGDTSMNSRLFVRGDVSLGANLFVPSDVSLSGKLFTRGDVSLGSRLFVPSDVSLGANLFVNGNMIVSGPTKLNGTLYSSLDASFGTSVFITSDLSLANGTAYLRKLSVPLDASFVGITQHIGNVGIGRAAPGVALDISCDGNSLSTGSNHHLRMTSTYLTQQYNMVMGVDTAGLGGIGYINTSGAQTRSLNLQTLGGNVAIGNTVASGRLHVYEPIGTSAAANGRGTMVLEHANAGGTSSLVFPSAINKDTEYGYIQYRDRSGAALSDYAYDFSSNVPFINYVNQGTVGGAPSYTSNLSFGYLSITVNPSIGGINLTPHSLRFVQTNLTNANATALAFFRQSVVKNSNGFAFSAFFNPSIVSAASCNFYICHLSNSSSTSVVDIFINGNDSKLYIYLNGNTTNYVVSSTALTINAWHFIAFSYDGAGTSIVSLNDNAGAISMTSVSGGFSGIGALNAYNIFHVGSRFGFDTGSSGNKGFHGYMNYVNVFRNSITNDEISALSNVSPNNGVLMLGIENDPTGYNTDNIVLWPGSGAGRVGVNTMAPVQSLHVNGNSCISRSLAVGKTDITSGYALDVSGNINLSGNIFQNGVLFSGGGGGSVGPELTLTGNLIVNRDVSFGANLYVGGNIGVGLTAPLGELHIYESVGSAASATKGTILLEHGDLAGASSVVFRSVGDNSGNEYGYLQYRDRGSMPMSDYAYDLSAGSGTVINGATIANRGTVGGSLTAYIANSSDCSLAWLANPVTNPYNITLPSTVLRFGQSNLTELSANNIAYLSQSIAKTSDSLSFTAWIYPYTTNVINCNFHILDINNSNTSVFNIFISGGKIYVSVNNNRTNYFYKDLTLSINTWYHIAVVYNGSSGTFYINNDSTNNISIGTIPNPLNNYNGYGLGVRGGFGTGGSGNKGFHGLMCNVTLNDYALSATEVTTLYNNRPANAILTLGIENDATGVGQDSIVLWPNAGTGFVGVNNSTPLYPLDVSGTMNLKGNLLVNNGSFTASIVNANVSSYSTLSNFPYNGILNLVSGRSTVITSDRVPMICLEQYGATNIAWDQAATITMGSNSLTSPGQGTALEFVLSYANNSGQYDHARILTLLSDSATTGRVGINNTAPSTALHVTGVATATSFNATSDYRIKTDLLPIYAGVDKLNPVSFFNKELGKRDIGFIAHEVQTVFPELVNGEKDGEQMQTLNYTGLIGVLTKEIKDLKQELNETKQELNTTKQELNYLVAKLSDKGLI